MDWLVVCLVRLLYLLLCVRQWMVRVHCWWVWVFVLAWAVWMVCLFVCFDMVGCCGVILVVVFAMR